MALIPYKKRLRQVRGRARIIYLLLVMVLLCSLYKLVRYQIVDQERLEQEAQHLITGELEQLTPRGSIVDRNGDVLAVSTISETLIIDNGRMLEWEQISRQKGRRDAAAILAKGLAPILQLPEDQLYADISAPGHYLELKQFLTVDEAQAARELVRQHNICGLVFKEQSHRTYPKNKVAAHVVGFVGRRDYTHEEEGREGIEYVFDTALQEQRHTYFRMEDSAQNRLWGGKRENEQEPNAPTLYLTLDNKIQYALETSLDRAMEQTKAKAASAIIMNPYTGEILGMANRPTFNPNMYYEYSAQERRNLAVGFNYEPGSVFKPIVGCMGLAEGIIEPQSPLEDKGFITVAGSRIKNWDGEAHGRVQFRDVIKDSLNTGMVQLGMELGGQRMTRYAKRFGFGEPTGIELNGEESGILYSDGSMMYDPEVATMAIGQGISVTPLQELRAICAIANGGRLMKPYIVQKIVDGEGKLIEEFKPEMQEQVISERVASQMREMMELVVREGGGKPAAIKGYRIAGKTGTAEKTKATGGYDPGKYIASFVGFVPADKPLYAMLVLLDQPKGAFYGSQVAAPVFRDTLQQVLVAKGIQPSSSEGLPSLDLLHKQGLEHMQKAGAKPKAAVQLRLEADGSYILPSLEGMDLRHTAELLEQGGLRLQPHGSGSIYRQEPKAGTKLYTGSQVEVWCK